MACFAPDKLILKGLFSMSETDERWDAQKCNKYKIIAICYVPHTKHRNKVGMPNLKVKVKVMFTL